MPANNDPIYSRASDLQANITLLTTVAATPYDAVGTIGTDIIKLFTADATNGGFVQRLRLKYIGSTTSIACILRLFWSTLASGTTSAANTFLFDEIALPATGAASLVVPLPSYDMPMNLALPATYTLLAKITVAQTAAMGWQVSVIAGKY